jgi:hypothetical protein
VVRGVDYAWDRPRPTGLAAAGKKFACRYGGPGSAGKQLDPAEARALRAAGLSIVANAEGAEGGLLGGFTVGAAWARSANAHFRRCGMPAGRPIYLSVDFDVTAAQWPRVANALRGAASVIGPARVGVYGGLRAVRWARRDHVARWFWQTYAWSGGVWAAGNHIEQYNNNVPLAGGTVDLNRAHPADYGQWKPGEEVDMPITDADAVKIWTHDLHNGPGEDPAYRVLNRAAADAAAAKAGVDQILAILAAGLAPEQLAAVAAAAEAGAEKGVDDALEGATVTTTIDAPEPP